MVADAILYVIAFAVLALASVSDIKTREVPDALNFCLVASGIGINLVLSFVYSDFTIIARSIAGLTVFMLISLGMYYSGQWGGGDSKLLIGLGALMGINLSADSFMVTFFILLMVVGAIYGITWSAYLGIRNFPKLRKEISRISGQKDIRYASIAIFSLVVVIAIGMLFSEEKLRIFLLLAALLAIIALPLWIFIKAVENACMKRLVEPEKLTEGDWVAGDIVVGGKTYYSKGDLGISKKQIRALLRLKREHKIKKVLVKEGIPFVPSFLLAFLLTLLFRHGIQNIVKTFI